MFYCNDCGSARGWPINTLMRSTGPCEVCKVSGLINDVKASELPKPEKKGQLVTVCITVYVEDGEPYESQLQQMEVCARGVFKVSEVRCGTYIEDETYYPVKED